MSEIKLYYLPIVPVKFTSNVLDQLVDASPDVIVLEAFCSGTVPQYILPQIEKATKKGIPVFSIRASMVDRWRTEWSDWKEEILPGLYGPENLAIHAGLIPLQKDLVKKDEVVLGLTEICKAYTTYEERVKAACERFSSPAFAKRFYEIRNQSKVQV